MSLFLGPMRHHIPGKKELTESVPLMELQPKKEVYIPLVAGANTDFEIFVQEGDAVKVGTKLACTKAGFCVPIYSSVYGTYKGIVKRMHNSLRPQNHMVIECDGKQEKICASVGCHTGLLWPFTFCVGIVRSIVLSAFVRKSVVGRGRRR